MRSRVSVSSFQVSVSEVTASTTSLLKLSVYRIWIGYWNEIVGLDLDLKKVNAFIFVALWLVEGAERNELRLALLFQNVLKSDTVLRTISEPYKDPKFVKFENKTLVQTPEIIDASEIQQCFYLSNDIYCLKTVKTPGTPENKKWHSSGDSGSEKMQNPAESTPDPLPGKFFAYKFFAQITAKYPLQPQKNLPPAPVRCRTGRQSLSC